MGHPTHTNPLTRKSSLCKICTSGICDEIDQALVEGKTRIEIIAWAEKAEPGINLKIWNLTSHKKKHIFGTKKKQLKILQLKSGEKEEGEEKEEEEGLSDEHILSLSSFLDLVIEKVNTAIKEEKVIPTVAEGVKAAEIKAKIKESTKFEKELVKFFTKVSLEHGYST